MHARLNYLITRLRNYIFKENVINEEPVYQTEILRVAKTQYPKGETSYCSQH